VRPPGAQRRGRAGPRRLAPGGRCRGYGRDRTGQPRQRHGVLAFATGPSSHPGPQLASRTGLSSDAATWIGPRSTPAVGNLRNQGTLRARSPSTARLGNLPNRVFDLKRPCGALFSRRSRNFPRATPTTRRCTSARRNNSRFPHPEPGVVFGRVPDGNPWAVGPGHHTARARCTTSDIPSMSPSVQAAIFPLCAGTSPSRRYDARSPERRSPRFASSTSRSRRTTST
jgi:hypothetical protein